ncbi:hypothetical protein DFH08DRAFT_1087724 [Mycena albidolilacea]|uniref:Uncharacterized protein n=1 Tax=Mycena albidolilacea TaxID=1033008 RepID=A0AAD6Z819_9AGAR|nr:hypothetical protein DFH08DRAFT_1087724 [Mycena albidolilacea]
MCDANASYSVEPRERAVPTEVAEQFAKEEEVCLFLLVLPKAEHGADDVLRRCHRERVLSRASGDGMERRVVRVPAGGGTISDPETTLPTGTIAGLLVFFSLNLNLHHGKTLREYAREFDFIELFLFVGGVCLRFEFGDKPATIALLVAGGVALVFGVFFENWTERSPIIPPRLFKTRTTGLIFVTAFFHALAYFAAVFYLPLYFQILGASATKSGLLIMLFLLALLCRIGGQRIYGCYDEKLQANNVDYLCCYGSRIRIDDHARREDPHCSPNHLTLIVGLGFGGLFVPPLIGLQAAMLVKDMATSSTIFGLFRSLGCLRWAGDMAWGNTPREPTVISGLTRDLSGAARADSARQIQSIEPESLRQQAPHAYTKGVSTVWLVNTPIISVGFVAALFLKKDSLKRKIIRTGKKGAEVVVPDDAEKGEASAEDAPPSLPT